MNIVRQHSLGGVSMLAILAWWSSGCGGIVYSLPPTTMTPTSLTQTPAGAVVVDAGLAPTMQLTNQSGFPLDLYNYGGMVPLSLRYGINDTLDLSVSWGAYHPLAPLGAVQVGMHYQDYQGWDIGFFGGLGVNVQQGLETIQTVDVDENGNPRVDEFGNPIYTTEELPFGALMVTPNVGMRVSRALGPSTTLVGAARLSYPLVIPLYGDITPVIFPMLEPELGLVTSPLEGLQVGLGLGLAWPGLIASPVVETWGLVPKLSVSYAFPLKK